MERHPVYKESNNDWVGSIPEHWDVIRMKHACTYQNGYAYKSEDLSFEGEVPVIRIGDLKQGEVDIENAKSVSVEIHSQTSEFEIKNRDILIALTGATIGKSAVFNHTNTALLNQRVAKIRTHSNIVNQDYISHWLKSNLFTTLIDIECFGGAQENIGKEQLNDFILPLPPLPEQEAIASYLDRKTKQIDDLIAKKEHLIKLKKEERAAIINQAVTKGLEPDVTMKDSGIEWLGEIPEHWTIKKVVYLLKPGKEGIRIGPFGSSLRSDLLVEDGVKIYGQENVIKDDFSLGYRYITNDYFMSDLSDYELSPGDLAVTMMGTTGKAKIIPEIEEQGIMDSHLIRIRLKPKEFIPELLAILINDSYALRNNISAQSRGSIMEGLNSGIIKSLLIPAPPLKEQKRILEYLLESMPLYNKALNKVGKQIDLLKEYRTALISEAVTGKIKISS